MINGIGSLGAFDKCTKKEWAQFMNALKILIRSTHCVVILSISKNLFSDKENLRNLVFGSCDFGMSLEILHNSKMFRDFSAIMSFVKVGPMLKFKQYPLEHNVYGIKVGKSELEVELLYENSLAHTETNTQDTKKVGGFCGGGPGINQNLEF